MDTIYYSLNTRKIKVSGGADLLTFVPAPVAAPAGEVLDFDRCRRKLETKAAWKALQQTAQEAPETAPVREEPQEVRPAPRRERTAAWLELGASAAVILAALAAAAAFLRLL